MDLIDEEGRLFGVVNVVDALVVLGVLAVVVAGVAFINPFASSDDATRYATIEVDGQPSYVAERISPGDVMSPAGTQKNLTVTDVYRTPGSGENVSVTMRVRVEGKLVEREQQPGTIFEYAGTAFTPGIQYTVSTGEYTVGGRVTSLSDSGETLPIEETAVRFTGTVPVETADAIAAGDRYQVAGSTVATIESLHIAPGGSQATQQVTIGATIQTLNERQSTFADQPVTLGRTLRFENGAYAVSGQLTAVGTTSIETETTEVVTETTVPQTVADSITAGDTYELAGGAVGTITSVTEYPTADATQKRMVLGLELQTVTRSGSTRFGSNAVSVGSTIPFRTNAYQFGSSIQAIGTTTPPGESGTRTVVVQLESVSPELAESLHEGLTEQQRGSTTARVQSVRVEQAVVSLTSESGDVFRRQHPVQKDVYLTVEASVRETQSGLTFHGRSLQESRGITLDFRTVTVNGEVIEIQP
jgi:hypothetical protein